jgi:hypothetical protein
MSDLLPQLIVLALGGAIAPPLLLLTILFWDSRFWDSQRPLYPTPPPSGSGTSLFCAAMGSSGLTLFAEEAASLRAPEDERSCPKGEKDD